VKRREFLTSSLMLAAASMLGAPPARAATERVRPGMTGWPTDTDWADLKRATGGRLAPVTLPKAEELIKNPFYIRDQPGLTQSSGWLDAWRSQPSAYAVEAESAADIVAAVRFAKAHNLRLVVKGGGHSYFGTSCAPDSLLIWTRRMNAITVHDAFTPEGSNAAPVPAISVGAGSIWLHVYQAVTGGAGRYVQGGGCTTVGVGGLLLGNGFGSFSKAYGSAGASLLEAEIVTADGAVHVVNAALEPDLFWALKGGGGGTFGVVTRFTLATHALPETFGAASLTLKAHSDEAFRKLLARFVALYEENLFNPHWGEQARARPDNVLQLSLTFQGLSKAEATAAFKPLLEFVDANKDDYEGQNSLSVASVWARYLWNGWLYRTLARSVVEFDQRSGASWTDFWWADTSGEIGAFWHAYASAWMPQSLLKPENQQRLVTAWFAASRQWGTTFHFNKGLAGAPEAALRAARDTATNPDMVDAFALAIIGAAGPAVFDGLPAPDLGKAAAQRDRVYAAMAALRAVAPDTGAYFNESDYFQKDWQQAFWGANYERLLEVKRRYDPDGLFYVHHGVGSEGWSADGFAHEG
jgi:FAD/FMN-containing dehydrogenase